MLLAVKLLKVTTLNVNKISNYLFFNGLAVIGGNFKARLYLGM